MSRMSQRCPFTVSNEHNRMIHYRKASPAGNKIKSGILERYTYKSDKGELLPSTSIDLSNNRNTRIRNNSFNIPDSRIGTNTGISNLSSNIIRKRSVSVRTTEDCTPDSDKMLFKSKDTTNSCKTTNMNTVRTEHCDSTTDVDIITKKKKTNIGVEKTENVVEYHKKIVDASDTDDEMCQSHSSRLNENPLYTSCKSINLNEDSDSDCQIVDVKSLPLDKNKKRISISQESPLKQSSSTKILEWMIIAEKTNNLINSVHVISDSESESDSNRCSNVQINSLTSCNSPEIEDINKSTNRITTVAEIHESNNGHRKTSLNEFSDSDNENFLLDSKIDVNQLLEPSVYEISDGIKIILPPKNGNPTFIKKNIESPVINNNLLYLSPKRNNETGTDYIKPRFEILSNIVVKPTITPVINSTYECNNSTTVSSSGSQPLKNKSLLVNETKESKDNAVVEIEKTCTELSSPIGNKLQKNDASLSPESMKTEFYSYLKINTNPSAQKAETVIQNRRSIRVKNLITQNEKLKEKNESKIETEEKIQKINEIRKKFLKYSKSKIQFPSPVLEHNTFIDFEDQIEKYFTDEGMSFKTQLSSDDQNDEKTNRTPLNMSEKNKNNFLDIKDKSYNHKKKIMYKKMLLKQVNLPESERKIIQKNKENLFFKRRALLKSKAALRKLNKTSRILRNRRITRHTLALEDYKNLTRKILKTQKVKMKAKNRKKELAKALVAINSENKAAEKQNISSPIPLIDTIEKINNDKSPIVISVQTVHKIKDSPSIKSENCTNLSNNINESSFITTKETEKTENLEINLSPLDKFDLLTKTYMAENSMNQNDYCMDSPNASQSTSSNCYNGVQTVQSSFDIKQNLDSDISSNIYSFDDGTATSSKNLRKPSPTENCLGFQPDESIGKIRKNMQNVILNMNVKPIVLIPREEVIQCNDAGEIIQRNGGLNSGIGLLQTSVQSNSTLLPESEDDIPIECELNIYETEELCVSPEVFNSETVKCDNVKNYIPLNPNIKTKSFHHSLLHTPSKRKSNESYSKNEPLYAINSMFSLSDTDSDASETLPTSSGQIVKKKSRTHEIDIKKQNGPVFNAYYVNCTLIIVQELLISFWKQTPLGNVLGAQNMWYSIGNIKRLVLERGCINRRSSEMVLCVDGSVAYVELWTKEHQSDFRERPVTDVFATVYFHKEHGSPDKQVLQLENIKGYGKDVRFAVMKNCKEIVVSWYDTYSKPTKTIIRSYQLAPDFQTVAIRKEMESVEHYVLSLHNIGNCETLVLGAGSDQISVWNLAHGWLSTQINFSVEPSLQIHSMCLWAQCETGYLFLLQQIGRGMLRLVAINGVSSQWKQLQIYHVPECYESLLGVTIESGILMTCYTNGFLCYEMQSGELLTDTETPMNRIILPSDKFLVSIDDYQVSVKHVMVYVLEN